MVGWILAHYAVTRSPRAQNATVVQSDAMPPLASERSPGAPRHGLIGSPGTSGVRSPRAPRAVRAYVPASQG
jgi:hypothetical protein